MAVRIWEKDMLAQILLDGKARGAETAIFFGADEERHKLRFKILGRYANGSSRGASTAGAGKPKEEMPS